MEIYRVMKNDYEIIPDLDISDKVLRVCIKLNLVQDFLELVELVCNNHEKDLYTHNIFTIIVQGYCQWDKWEHIASLLGALNTSGGTKKEKQNIKVYGIIIDNLAKQGQITSAVKIYETLLAQKQLKPTNEIYSSLIVNLGRIGYLEQALRLLEDMKAIGVEPDHITYTSLIDA
eukprot:UN25104